MKKFTFILLFTLGINVFHANAQLSVYTEGLQPGMTFNEFGGSNAGATTDDATVAHTGTTSLKVVVAAANYVGGAIKAAAPTNLSTYNALTFWVKASAAKTLNTAGIFNNASANVYQTEYRNVAVTTTWTKVTIPIPNPAKMTAEDGLFHFAEGGDEGAYTLWFDDIQYETVSLTAPVASIVTETVNKSVGDAFSPTVAACTINGVPLAVEKANFTFTSSNAGIASVNTIGVGAAVAAGTATITAKLGTTNASGVLTVVVSAAPSGPTVAAPTPPARTSTDVISVFSNAYTNLTGTDFFPNWGQSTVVTDVVIAGNDTKKYASFNYEGTQFATPINASTMQKLHIDYWSSTMNSFDVFLVNIPPLTQTEQKVTVTPTLSGWNSFDILLSSYGAINMSGIGQFKLEGRPSGGIVYLDNIYFYKAVVAPTAPTVAAPNPTKLPANVISLFSGVYTDVAATDWFPNWGQSTVVTEEPIAGNPTKKFANINYQGTQFANPINLTSAGMTNMHLDYWSSSVNSFDVFLINIPPLTQAEQKVTLTPTLSGWNSIDILLSSYNTLNLSGIGQIKWEGRPSGGTLYMDNIYFWKPPVIPVELVSFKAKTNNNTTVLTWLTASESNNQGFTIERSTDGTNSTAIGQVKGNGTTSAAHTYTFTDNTPSVGSNYYRLRQTDLNGKEVLSSVVSVLFGKGGLIVRSTLVHNTLDVTANDASVTPLSIFNLSGQQVYGGKVQGSQSIDVSALATGMYIVRTAAGEVGRFVKQ